MKAIEEIIEFANQNPAAWLATAQDNQPHVRAMAMWFADKTGFYFHTGTHKRLSTQLNGNPRVEIGFFNPGEGMDTMQMVRVTGSIEMVHDAALEKKLFEERSWLNAIKAAWPNERIFIFRIAHGEAQYWNMSLNCMEKDTPPIVF
ncbi:MAG: pyridoxamine 5'-phosphate oxidase family protein [Phycisphaerae bacterium]|nr:pyridoxamine 5'-phosphate oxidase family protein [Phycisphaerae bacterium]